MPGLVQLGVALYELLLPIFPPDLRAGFQDAMIRTFEEQLESAWRGRSLTGVASAWKNVMTDLLDIALPYRARAAVVPVLTLLTSSGLFYLALWGIAPNCHCLK